MGVVFLIVIGGMLGWLAAIIARADSGEARARSIVTGIAGALTAGLAANPLIGGGDLLGAPYSIGAMVIALAGSVALLLAMHLLRDRELR